MKLDYLYIIPECYADTNLIQTLLQIKGANHQKSCGQVTNEMKQRFHDDFAVGIIDLDKKQEAKNDPELTNIFKKLSSSSEMTLLKDVIAFLCKEKYNIKHEAIQEIFHQHGFMTE